MNSDAALYVILTARDTGRMFELAQAAQPSAKLSNEKVDAPDPNAYTQSSLNLMEALRVHCRLMTRLRLKAGVCDVRIKLSNKCS